MNEISYKGYVGGISCKDGIYSVNNAGEVLCEGVSIKELRDNFIKMVTEYEEYLRIRFKQVSYEKTFNAVKPSCHSNEIHCPDKYRRIFNKKQSDLKSFELFQFGCHVYYDKEVYFVLSGNSLDKYIAREITKYMNECVE